MLPEYPHPHIMPLFKAPSLVFASMGRTMPFCQVLWCCHLLRLPHLCLAKHPLLPCSMEVLVEVPLLRRLVVGLFHHLLVEVLLSPHPAGVLLFHRLVELPLPQTPMVDPFQILMAHLLARYLVCGTEHPMHSCLNMIRRACAHFQWTLVHRPPTILPSSILMQRARYQMIIFGDVHRSMPVNGNISYKGTQHEQNGDDVVSFHSNSSHTSSLPNA